MTSIILKIIVAAIIIVAIFASGYLVRRRHPTDPVIPPAPPAPPKK